LFSPLALDPSLPWCAQDIKRTVSNVHLARPIRLAVDFIPGHAQAGTFPRSGPVRSGMAAPHTASLLFHEHRVGRCHDGAGGGAARRRGGRHRPVSCGRGYSVPQTADLAGSPGLRGCRMTATSPATGVARDESAGWAPNRAAKTPI
jgi:hypothetical protein